MTDLEELFLNELADIYHAEKQLSKALPKMAKAAHSADLKHAFDEHCSETEEHISRLEEVFEIFGKRAKGKKCEGIEGIVSESKEMLSEFKKRASLDAGLIASAQKAEHYEIASYGTLCTWAKQLGKDRVLSLLKQNLQEEKAADQKLTGIAESHTNIEADQAEAPVRSFRLASSRSR